VKKQEGLTFFHRNPKKTIFFVTFCLIVLLLLVVELFLALLLPSQLATIGHRESHNARLYGWGFRPYENINITDPDTGEIYISHTNNHGWRDRDRTYSNEKDAYRIVILGDSNTFGAIVPAEKVYTRILENTLQKYGYNVEVINISYAGWGTDQQLEALKNEGLKYDPDLVIFQFSLDDLSDNTYFTASHQEHNKQKPFYYTLDENGSLIRKINPLFMNDDDTTDRKDKTMSLILKSQIVKRIYYLYMRLKLKKLANIPTNKGLKLRYSVSKKQLEQLKFILQLSENDKLIRFLKEKTDHEINKNKLVQAITRFGHEENKNKILRILETRRFHNTWSKERYFFKKQDTNSFKWKLYFELIKHAHELLNNKAKMALFLNNDDAQYEWLVSWYRISNNKTSKTNYLEVIKIINNFAEKNGIYFINNIYSHTRARNDPHPSIEGNEAMALNMFHFLMTTLKSELESYHLKK
jgi:hypothetical protein